MTVLFPPKIMSLVYMKIQGYFAMLLSTSSNYSRFYTHEKSRRKTELMSFHIPPLSWSKKDRNRSDRAWGVSPLFASRGILCFKNVSFLLLSSVMYWPMLLLFMIVSSHPLSAAQCLMLLMQSWVKRGALLMSESCQQIHSLCGNRLGALSSLPDPSIVRTSTRISRRIIVLTNKVYSINSICQSTKLFCQQRSYGRSRKNFQCSSFCILGVIFQLLNSFIIFEKMFAWPLLLLALVLAVSAATGDFLQCSHYFSPQEWQKEGESYLFSTAEFRQYLQQQPYFLSKLLLLIQGKPQSFLELSRTAVSRAMSFNKLYLSTCALAAGLMLTFYLSRKKHGSSQVPFLSLLLVERARTAKYLKFGIILLLVLAAVFALKGMNEGATQEKAISQILCRALNTRKFFQKNNTFIGYGQMQSYIFQLSSKMYPGKFLETTNLQKKMRYAEYPQRYIEAIMHALEAQSYKGSTLQQLQSANKTLHFMSKFMINSSASFESKCRRNSLTFLFDILKLTQAADSLFNAARQDKIADLKFRQLSEYATRLGKACFLVILIIFVTAGALIFGKEQRHDSWLALLNWLRFAVSVIVILCFGTVIIMTLFLSFNFWTYQAVQLMKRDPYLCYDQFSVLSHKAATIGICRILSPQSKNVAKSLYLSPFRSKICQRHYDQFDQATRPYFAKSENYFYDLMVGSAQEIRSQAAKHEILGKIETRNAKVPLVPIMKDMSAHLAFFLKQEEEIQEQNINFTAFFYELLKLLVTHINNRAYAVRQICKALSIILIMILLLIDFAIWLRNTTPGLTQLAKRQKNEQSQIYELTEMASL